MMKKFIALTAFVVFGSAFAQTPTASTPATTASAPSTATATVVCKDDKQSTASATGNGARATASCNPQVVKKSASRPVAKPAPEVSTSAQDNAALVKALAEANVALRLSQSQQGVARTPAPSAFAPAPSLMEEGRVYSDADGNTVERHTAGTRECKVLANGQLVARAFVDGDKVASKKACDLFATETLAKMRLTSPDGRDNGPIVASLPVPTPAPMPNPAPQAGENPGHICAMTFNGKPVFEPFKAENEAACNVHREGVARKNGWVRSPQQPSAPRPTT
jgi:hypothetical protein